MKLVRWIVGGMAILGAACVTRHDHAALVISANELEGRDGQLINVVGTYHDPGKGDRYLDCGFAHLVIGDYSFYRTTSDGHLETDLKEGDRIEVFARLRIQPETLTDIATARTIQIQWGELRTIDGRQYVVSPRAFVIEKARLVARS